MLVGITLGLEDGQKARIRFAETPSLKTFKDARA